jgi:hypothetical protein
MANAWVNFSRGVNNLIEPVLVRQELAQ